MKRYYWGADEEPLSPSDRIQIAFWAVLVAAFWTLVFLIA
jgi:hypothetical protein